MFDNSRVEKVLSVFRSPLRYAIYLSDGTIVHDNTGLKGEAAEWARKHLEPSVVLDRIVPVDLLQCGSNFENLLQQCSHIVYAVGYQRNDLPEICVGELECCKVGLDADTGHILDSTGVMLPRMFGIGIAFPEPCRDVSGEMEERVGFWKFMCRSRSIAEKLIK
jgi:hypothetical protein